MTALSADAAGIGRHGLGEQPPRELVALHRIGGPVLGQARGLISRMT